MSKTCTFTLASITTKPIRKLKRQEGLWQGWVDEGLMADAHYMNTSKWTRRTYIWQ